MSDATKIPNATIAFVQNGRAVTWPEVTTEDLRASIENHPASVSACYSRVEWLRRMGRAYGSTFEPTYTGRAGNTVVTTYNTRNR